MPRIIRGALVQATWTGDKESMIQKHEAYAHEAAKQGAQFILFQELFYGPYFCQVQDAQYYSYTEHIPDGPTTKRMQDLAKQTGMVIVAPMYEEDDKAAGIYYNTAAVIDPDGSYLGKYRKTHIPHVKGFWEKFYFRPGNLGYPGVRHGGRQDRRLHLLRPPLPGRRAGTRPQRGRDRPDPERHLARAVRVPVADRAGQPRRRQRVLRRYDQPGRHRGRLRRRRLLRPELLRRSARAVRRRGRQRPRRGAHRARPRHRPRSPRSATPGSSTGIDGPTRTGTSRVRSSRYHPSGSAVWRRTAEPRGSRRGRQMPCSSDSRSSPTTRSSGPSP